MFKKIGEGIASPFRGIGRIARGNVRQGLRDLSGATKLAAAFVPGGAMAAGALGALGGAMGAQRGAGFGDVAKGAGGGALAGMGGQIARKGFQAGMADGGGIGGGIKGMFTGAGRTPGTPPAPSVKPLPPSQSMLSRAGKFATENAPLLGGIASGAGTAYSGFQQADVARGQLDLATRQQEQREREAQEERENRARIAELLAPLFRQMAERQGLRY